MEVRADILLIVLGSALVTVLPRVVPLVLLSRIRLPDWLRIWLNYVPVSVLAGLLASELFVARGELVPLTSNPALIAILPAILITARYGSIIGAVLASVGAMALLRAFVA